MSASNRFSTGYGGARLWTLASAMVAVVVALPIVVVLSSLFVTGSDSWAHLLGTVLPDYVRNTLLLMIAVAALSLLIGVLCAWLCAATEFPGRRFFSWALVLPLAAPAYVVAYVYTDLLEFAGPVQTILRDLTGWGARDYVFPQIRSLGGAAIMLGLVLYPYVYLLARAAFMSQSAALFEAARVLGATGTRAFFTVALPAARPAIAGGLALVMMETAADYGVVEYFGVPTFTTGIFRTWFAMGDRNAAVQLAAVLFLIVILLVLLEYFARRGRVNNPVSRSAAASPVRLTGFRALGATLFCSVVFLLGFVVPIAVLARYAITTGDPTLGRNFSVYVTNTFSVATITAVLAVLLALLLNYSARLHPTQFNRFGIRVATMGYAVPGAVLAVGVLVPLAYFDQSLTAWVRQHFDPNAGLLLTGTTFALIFGYLARFLTVAFNGVQGAMVKISPQLDAVVRSLGAGPGRLLREIHFPLMRTAIFSAALLVFIDVMKELPATLILRPFNFDTLATRVYRLASDERLPEASTAAICIVALGVIPALMLGLNRLRDRHSGSGD